MKTKFGVGTDYYTQAILWPLLFGPKSFRNAAFIDGSAQIILKYTVLNFKEYENGIL